MRNPSSSSILKVSAQASKNKHHTRPGGYEGRKGEKKMKKVTIMYTPFNETIKNFGGDILYVGIDRIHGGWMLTGDGEPTTLEDIENMEADARTEKEERYVSRLRVEIEHLAKEASEELTEEDREYITGVLEAWGLE